MHTLCPYRTVPWHKGQGYAMVSKQAQEASVYLECSWMMNIAIHCVCVNIPRA